MDITLQQKLDMYESVFNRIYMNRCITLDSSKVIKLMDNICAYMRAMGGGEMSEEEFESNLERKFYNLDRYD